MKSWVISLVGVLIFASSHSNAGHRHGNNAVYYDYGRVIKVRPVFQEISQRQSGQQCFHHGNHFRGRKNRNHNGHNSHTALPAVAGAIVGGAVGNSLGNKRNRGATTAAGAVIGGVVGHQIAQNRNTRHNRRQLSQATYCVDTWGQNVYNNRQGKRPHQGKRIRGYHVTYRYQGEKFTTITRQHPGARIEIEVSVKPRRFR